ncbi:MAG: hypothetical protein UT32_C0006G0029 [Parcubacteria group bacterium GW2011_GWC2_39_14]|nr:MAG: hypothetical protein UT32_C0006G0029 [Parcubacteria group bacterium GW2011_GWC2_39_14]KKR54817.1 MAG: hypothetical protein UT91_C0009G0029 [Parcubacteria group bacterium GW2011_GWA2_40_23]
MATQDPNQDQDAEEPEKQEDPKLENMDKLTDDVEKSLGSDIKRILQDKKQKAQQGQRLKSANIDFEVDTVTPTSKANPKTGEDKEDHKDATKESDSGPQPQADKSAPQATESKKTEPTEDDENIPTIDSDAPPIYDHPQGGTGKQETPSVDEPQDSEGDFPTVDSDAPPIYDFPQDGNVEGGDGEVVEGEEDAGDNPLDATKQGRGATATGENPPGGDAGDMGDKSVIDAHNEDKLAEKPDLRDEETKQLEKAHLNELKPGNKPDDNKYKSPGVLNPSDLANDMSGGGNTPKPNAMGGGKPGQGKDFQPGGGQVPPPEGEPGKPTAPEAEGDGSAEKKPGGMAQGAMDKGRQAADAVKAEVAAVKKAAQNVKDKLGAPGRKLAEAKEAISDFMDDMNPIKKLKKLFKSVSVPQLVGGLVRVYLTAQGMGTFVSMLDKMLKEENTNKLYTCCLCSSCCCACLFPFLPLIIAILAIAAAA